MYSGIKPCIGQFTQYVNELGQVYLKWKEMNFYSFSPSIEFHSGDFTINEGEIATLTNEKFTKIGYWYRQLDQTIFVCIEDQKQGYVLDKNLENKNIADVYWATVITPPDANSLNKIALNHERQLICNNPKFQ